MISKVRLGPTDHQFPLTQADRLILIQSPYVRDLTHLMGDFGVVFEVWIFSSSGFESRFRQLQLDIKLLRAG